MRSRYGVDVADFRYAFVLPRHAPGWDAPAPETRSLAGVASGNQVPAKSPRYIEVKPRPA